ncbi:MAG TPA: VTT domain-containing protein [Rhodanobacteraceae bacterium]|nr:VTT domain-containing protein [Rhodanobacteraceae bacterium]
MKRLRAFLPLIILIAIGAALIFSGALDRFQPSRIGAEQENLRVLISDYPLLSRLTQVVVVMLGISTGIPGVIVLIFAGGMLFGIVEGTILSGLGTTVGATILFLASRSAFAHGTGGTPMLVERLRAGYHAFPFSYTMFLRLVPFFPFGGVTVALAWLRCPLWLFITATALGGTVMIAFETALGAGLATTIAREGGVSLGLFAHKRVILPLLGMAVLALAPIVLGQLRRLGKKQEADAEKPEP